MTTLSARTSLAEAIRQVRLTGKNAHICCPAHDDSTPSLNITSSPREQGRILLKCHAGCPTDLVLGTAGLDFSALAPPSTNGNGNGNGRHAELDITYDYTDETGHLLFQVVRKPGKVFRQRRPDPDRPGEWIWNLGETRRVLYHLPQLVAAIKARQPVFLVEGEKDVAVCEAHGLIATCNSGGAGKWRPQYSQTLGRADVTIVQDKDEPGNAHAKHVAQSLATTGVKAWRIVEAVEGKDAADHFDLGHTVEEFVLIRGTPIKPVPVPAPAPTPPDEFRLSAPGNADRLVQRFGVDLRWIDGKNGGTWYIWDGGRFAPDRVKGIVQVARRVVDYVHEQASAAPESLRRDWTRHAMSSDTNAAINTSITIAATDPRLARTIEAFDANPYLMTVTNGTLDLKTHELLPHSHLHDVTKMADVAYDPAATCPRWEDFLWRVLAEDSTLIRFIQKAVGYSLTGVTKEQVLFFLYGGGANGKTTFVETLQSILGDYATTTPFDSFMAGSKKDSDAARPSLVKLYGARFVTSSEIGEGNKLNEPLVKALTGGNEVSIRDLYKGYMDFKPTFKMWLDANHKPVITGNDHGIWRRIRLIPFTVTIPEAEQDGDLGARLVAEGPGILNWALAGLKAWQAEGLGAPPAVLEATTAYRAESDDVGAFVADACVVAPNARTSTRPLYAAYRQWAQASGTEVMSEKRFSVTLQERGYVKGARTKAGVPWFGIAPVAPQPDEPVRDGLFN